jgi:hypothetical protein
MTAALRTGWERFALRLSDTLPALMIFGPVAGIISIMTATLADLRA